jgi:hypothetical protein
MKKQTLLVLLLALLLTLPTLTYAQDSVTYVIATHYPAFGGVDPAPTDAVEVAYGVFNNRENDYRAVTAQEAATWARHVLEATGLEPRLLNDWADVQEGLNTVQVVNNVPIAGALYTLFLPPGWTRAADLPVVLSGNGAGTSNNRRLYGDGETIPAELAAMSVQNGGSGLILAISNCGGTEGQGIDEPTYRSVGAFFDFIDQNGGDKHNAITAGGSRGGGSALMWAINPLDLDYTVNAVFAAVPPTHYGSLSQVSVLTYPSMTVIGTRIAHDPDSWRYDNAGMRPGMNPSPFMEALIGAGNPDEADALSAIGLAERLAGKQVFLNFGAHDSYFPLSLFLEFDRRLTELDIPHGTVITLAQGHEAARFWMETLYLYLRGVAQGLNMTVPTGRFYFVDPEPPDGREIALGDLLREQGLEASPADLPVIAQFPYRTGTGNPVDVEVCGTPGDEIVLSLANAAGEVVYELSGTIDADECLVDHTALNVPPGTYTWTLTANGEAINPLNTPVRGSDGCGLRAVTIVEADQPAPETTYAGANTLSFGLDEFSGQTCSLP